MNTLLGKRSQLVVTGMPGAGKTVLLDHLSGRGLDPSYEPPGRSAQVERETIRRTGKRLGMAVIPGQSAAPRLQAIDKLFLGKSVARGVVHVVSFGFTETRSTFAAEAMKSLDLDSLREQRLTEELDDLGETCQMIRSSWTRHRQPIWLIVAVNKIDLFSEGPSLRASETRYAGSGAFVETLEELQNRLGTDNFGWEALPVCSWLEDFVWHDETIKSTLDMSQRNALLGNLGDAIASRCEGGKGS